MVDFELTAEFQPTGDQPEAIKQLVDGIKRNDFAQTLLGVTGSGKTFTIANVIQEVKKPTLYSAITKRWQHSYTVNLSSSFQRMQLSILFLIMIIISLKPICQQRIHTSRKTFPSMMKLRN